MDLSEVNFTDNNFIEILTCSICQCIFEDPCRIECAHTYCRKCISDWMKNPKNTCPICRKKVNMKAIGQDKMAETIIKSLEVNCSNKGNFKVILRLYVVWSTRYLY